MAEEKKAAPKQKKKAAVSKKEAPKPAAEKTVSSNKLKVGTLVITNREKECKVLEVVSDNLFLLKRTDDTGKLYSLTKDQFNIK
jgi:hypothetical protein